MSDRESPGEATPSTERPARKEPFLFQLVRTAIAPPVLDDGGRDAPMSARGRLLFWGTIGLLVTAIAIVFVLTLAK